MPEIRQAGEVLLTRSWWLIALALMLEVAWIFNLANVYRSSVIGFGGILGRREAVRVSMGSFSLSRILPGGGAAGSIFAARELIALGNPASLTVTSMVVSWWVSMASLAAIVGAGTLTGVLDGHVAGSHLIGPSIVMAVLVGGGGALVASVRNDRSRKKIVSLIARLGSRLGVEAPTGAWEGAALSRVSPRLHRSWLADAAALWVMFLAFGERLHPGVLLVGYGLANLINALPELTPGWLGVLETALAVAYSALGVPAGTAVVAVLSYRILSYWLPTAAGVVPALRMLRRSDKANQIGASNSDFKAAA